MEIFQWASNPWGEEVLVRISWNLLYVFTIAGIAFLVMHALYVRFWAPRFAEPTPHAAGAAANVPARVPRHSLTARLFHWVMAASMFVLLFTGFLPVVGVQFDWVAIHWISGLVLIGSIIFHIVHSTFWMDLWAVWIDGTDIRGAMSRVKRALGRPAPTPPLHPKYPLENKIYHHVIVLAGGAAMLTGLVMMKRVETPFWVRDPYMFSDGTWGFIYVLHGLSSVALVTLVIAHVYFAIRPEKFWITKSMFLGWIDREHYVEHHDPQRWPVGPESGGAKPAAERERAAT